MFYVTKFVVDFVKCVVDLGGVCRRIHGLKSGGTTRSSAVGAEGMGRGEGACLLPRRLEGLRECCELPQRGPGQPRPPTILVHFGPRERRWWHKNLHIVATC